MRSRGVKVARRIAQTGVARSMDSLCASYRSLYARLTRPRGLEENGEAALVRASLDAFTPRSKGDRPVLFDVGANVGDWSELAVGSAELHLFEMAEASLQTLHEKFSLRDDVVVNNFALGNQEGFTEYKDYGDFSGKNTLVSEAEFYEGGKPKTCSVSTGDAYIERKALHGVHLLKIDVEGFELPVLEGFEKSLEYGYVNIIQFEYGFNNGEAHHLMMDFFEFLAPKGYRIGRLHPDGVRFHSYHSRLNNFDSGPNYVAARHEFVDRLEVFTNSITS